MHRVASIFDSLLELFSRDVTLTGDQVAFITSIWKPVELAKGESFHRAGDVTARGGFVVRGLLRTYAIDADGEETTLEFAAERSFVGDISSAVNDTPSPYVVDAIEPSTLLTIDLRSFNRQLDRGAAIGAACSAGKARCSIGSRSRLAHRPRSAMRTSLPGSRRSPLECLNTCSRRTSGSRRKR
jgi:CRP-like cAMP-binding protein